MFLCQIHFNIVLALYVDHTSGLCHSLFQLKFCMPFHTCTALLMLLDLITQRYLVNGINNETSHLPIMQFCQASWYLLSHMFKHNPWHLVLNTLNTTVLLTIVS